MSFAISGNSGILGLDPSLDAADEPAEHPAADTAAHGGVAQGGSESPAHDVGKPGFAESLIPIWGSGREAIHDFQTGHWGWGAVNTALAVTDVFLVKSLVTAGAKIVVKGVAEVAAKEGASVLSKEGAEVLARQTAEKEAAELASKEAAASAAAQESTAKLADKAAGEAAVKVAGRVGYGMTDLSRAAIDFRKLEAITGPRNVAVFEYVQNGVKRTMAMASERGVGHAERLLAKELESRGVDPKNVTRIYSELEPCMVPGGYCKSFLAKTFPQAAVTWSFEYGASQASRSAGVEALKSAVQDIFK